MVISCSTCQKEEKECIWNKYLIYAVLSQFQICRNLRTFLTNQYSQNFRVHKKRVFSNSGYCLHLLFVIIVCIYCLYFSAVKSLHTHTHCIGCRKIILLRKFLGKLLKKLRAICCFSLKFQHVPCIFIHLSRSYYPVVGTTSRKGATSFEASSW